MSLGLLGRKLGMTQINTDAGQRISVTVLEIGPCLIMQKKTPEKDGYSAVKLAFGEKKAKQVTKPLLGQFEKLNAKPRKFIREFRVDVSELGELEAGKELTVDSLFEQGQFVDVVGKSRGKGFAGVMKRWNMKGAQTQSHGTHEAFRHGGSIGQHTYPGRVIKGKKMPGQLGNKRVTVPNLKVVDVLAEENCILVEGGVPGAPDCFVEIRHAVRKPAPEKKKVKKEE